MGNRTLRGHQGVNDHYDDISISGPTLPLVRSSILVDRMACDKEHDKSALSPSSSFGNPEDGETSIPYISALELTLLQTPLFAWPILSVSETGNQFLLDSILSFYDHHHCTLFFLRSLIESHVEDTSEFSLLFRSNPPLCSLIARYMKRIGLPYLQQTLRGPLSIINHFQYLYEWNTLRRFPPRPEVTEEPVFQLFQHLCQGFVDSITMSTVPPSLQVILHLIYNATERKFPCQGLNHSCSIDSLLLRSAHLNDSKSRLFLSNLL